MSWLTLLGRQAIAFFVDDALLGTGTVATVIIAAAFRGMLTGRPLVAGALLAGGCLLALTLSVARAVGRSTPDR